MQLPQEMTATMRYLDLTAIPRKLQQQLLGLQERMKGWMVYWSGPPVQSSYSLR